MISSEIINLPIEGITPFLVQMMKDPVGGMLLEFLLALSLVLVPKSFLIFPQGRSGIKVYWEQLLGAVFIAQFSCLRVVQQLQVLPLPLQKLQQMKFFLIFQKFHLLTVLQRHKY